jgi:hypothetical protein
MGFCYLLHSQTLLVNDSFCLSDNVLHVEIQFCSSKDSFTRRMTVILCHSAADKYLCICIVTCTY